MRFVTLFFSVLISLVGHSQNLVSQQNIPLSSEQDFNSFVLSFKQMKRNDFAVAKSLFNQAHRKFLKNYSAYAQVNDIFEKGNYDCLTGTYFLATALDQLGFSFKIIETNYHVFITVQTTKGEVLLESTDRYHGFIIGVDAIKEKINNYKQIEITSNNAQLYLSSVHLFHELSASQLPGLLYFNQAVNSYHKNDLNSSCSYLEKAWKVYDNPRIKEFAPILIRTIILSDLEEKEKKQLTSILREHQRSALLNTLASR